MVLIIIYHLYQRKPCSYQNVLSRSLYFLARMMYLKGKVISIFGKVYSDWHEEYK